MNVADAIEFEQLVENYMAAPPSAERERLQSLVDFVLENHQDITAALKLLTLQQPDPASIVAKPAAQAR